MGAHATGSEFGSLRTVIWDPLRTELRRVADKSPLMVWITEPDGYCIYLNQNWYEFTGQKPHAGEGDGWTKALHRDDRQPAHEAFLAATSRQGIYHTEYRLCRHDTEYRWVVAIGHPYFTADGTLAGYVGSDASAEGLAMSRHKGDTVLTPRERQVVQWVAGGKTSIEISVIIGIASRTVEQHVQAAMVKLGATNRVQLAVEAAKRGEIEI